MLLNAAFYLSLLLIVFDLLMLDHSTSGILLLLLVLLKFSGYGRLSGGVFTRRVVIGIFFHQLHSLIHNLLNIFYSTITTIGLPNIPTNLL